MPSKYHDPHGVLSHAHVNVLFAGSVNLQQMEGMGIRKRLICFEDGKVTEEHLNAYRSWHEMFVILDSGAFSAWTKGKVIDIDEYARFILEYGDIINMAANLDVIPGRKGRKVTQQENAEAPELGWQNYLHLQKFLTDAGRHDLASKVMPIHHQGESLDFLKRMVDCGCEYVGISPSNDAKTRGRQKYLDQVFSYLDDQPSRILTHGYAVTSEVLMKSYDWHTVDSITWIYLAGFGVIKTPYGSFCFSDDPRSLNNKENLRVVVDDSGNWQIQNALFQSDKDTLDEYITFDLMTDVSALMQDYVTRARSNVIYFTWFERNGVANKRKHYDI